jgi:hypothetical protein
MLDNMIDYVDNMNIKINNAKIAVVDQVNI